MKVGYMLAGITPRFGGIYQYSIYILNMLIDTPEIESIYLYCSNNQKVLIANYSSCNKITIVRFNKINKLHDLVKKIGALFISPFWASKSEHKWMREIYLKMQSGRHFMNRQPIDVLHVPWQFSPLYKLKFPVIITMHDIQHIHFPEFFPPRERIAKEIYFMHTLHDADHIIVSYKHVKDDLPKYYDIPETKISTCMVPINDDWIKGKKIMEWQMLQQKYGIQPDYLLTPAATWEHKNHKSLLHALEILKRKGIKLPLVCTGKKTDYYSTLHELVKELDLEEQVYFLDLVPENDLYNLYKYSRLTVIPTLYEAGSGPLIEAMRYQIPVICSNVTSLPDTIGDTRFVFDPQSPEGIADKIEQLYMDVELRRENIENSINRMKFYTAYEYPLYFVKTYKLAIDQFKKN